MSNEGIEKEYQEAGKGLEDTSNNMSNIVSKIQSANP